MRNSLILLLLSISSCSFAQEYVQIDRNKKTQALFDESNPYSFISVLKLNADQLAYYNLHGIDSEVFEKLNNDERNGLYKFEGIESWEPLYDEWGEPMIEFTDDGEAYYLYPPRDSIFIDLDNISRIIFTLDSGDADPFNRLKELQLWKGYGCGMTKVASIDAPRYMKFESVSIVHPVETQDKLIGLEGQASLWSVMRDSSIQRLKAYLTKVDKGVYVEDFNYSGNGIQDFFRGLVGLDFFNGPPILRELQIAESRDYFNAYFDFDRILPFSIKIGTSMYNGNANTEMLLQKFDSVYSIEVQSNIPLVDEYGDPLSVMNALGGYEYVYPEPQTDYFFVDYEPSIMISKKVKCDTSGNCVLAPKSLLFCFQEEGKKPELISEMQMTFDEDYWSHDFLQAYLSDFVDEDLWSLPDFVMLKEVINNKKNRKTYTFEESTEPCIPCVNKKGRYAFCWKGKPVTEYIYDAKPYNNYNGFWVALKGTEKFMLDSKAKVVFSGEFDWVYVVYAHENTFLGKVGDKWMIFSKDGRFKLPLTRIPDGESLFNIDGDSYANLEHMRIIVKDERGLEGLVNTKGDTLIPFAYSEISVAQTYGLVFEEKLELLSSAIGKIGQNDVWQVFDKKFQPSIQVKGGEFVKVEGAHVFFKNGNQIAAINAITGELDHDFFANRSHSIIYGLHLNGVLDSTGYLLIPMKFYEIRTVKIGELKFFFCSNKKKGFTIFDVTGQVVNTFPESFYDGEVCISIPGYYSIVKERKTGVIHYKQDSRQFETLFDSEFSDVYCYSGEGKGSFAIAELKKELDLKEYLLFLDGHKELIPK